MRSIRAITSSTSVIGVVTLQLTIAEAITTTVCSVMTDEDQKGRNVVVRLKIVLFRLIIHLMGLDSLLQLGVACART